MAVRPPEAAEGPAAARALERDAQAEPAVRVLG